MDIKALKAKGFLGYNKRCGVCAKVFHIPGYGFREYVYKYSTGKGVTKYYCSWTCHRVAEREREGTAKKGSRLKSQIKYAESLPPDRKGRSKDA